MQHQISIPSEAADRIIGLQGRNIKAMQNIPGITNVKLTPDGLNFNNLTIEGDSQTAIDQVSRMVNKILGNSKRILNNKSRKEHSWTITDSGEVRTPEMVHSLKPPRKGSKKYWRQQDKIKEIIQEQRFKE